ncbi:MAG: peptidase, family [Firmicutes bacterium]|nr:peptidase, family [Bacillota bacterium]
MTTKEYKQLGEVMVEEHLENGLGVFVFPKQEYGKCFAFFATCYGGMDTRFRWNNAWQDTPMGVAHFLEHKMFDTKDGNALQILTANGASPNAFTGSAITGYYFEGTESFEENLRTLLSFVSEGYFTQESVDKEQGIIGQEIQMIEDNPNWQAYMKLMEALYGNHPIRNSVAGTRESIAQITAETLYNCHSAFYNPGNMVLCVAGDVAPDRVCEIAREILPQGGQSEIPRDYGIAEREAVHQSEQEYTMEVATPLFQLGVKLTPAKDGQDRLRQKLLGELLCEAWVGTSSPLYARLYAQGLINSSFGYGYEDEAGIAFLIAGGESRDPAAVRAALLEEAARISREGLDEGLFRRLLKAAYGNQVRAMNSFEHLCVEQAKGYFAGQEIWTFPEMYAGIQKEDVEAAIGEWILSERVALSVIRPKEVAR